MIKRWRKRGIRRKSRRGWNSRHNSIFRRSALWKRRADFLRSRWILLHGPCMEVHPKDILAEESSSEILPPGQPRQPAAEVSTMHAQVPPEAEVSVIHAAAPPKTEVSDLHTAPPEAEAMVLQTAHQTDAFDYATCDPKQPAAAVSVMKVLNPGTEQEQSVTGQSISGDMEEKQNKTTEYEASPADSEMIRLQAAIEAILFTMGDALPVTDISRALNVDKDKVISALERLEEKYNQPGSGIMLQRFENSVQMCTRPEQYENLVKIASVPRKMVLTNACIETLSIIAYKQPVTRVEIEDIRGVSCGYAIDRLLEFNLIEEKGRKETIGRPILFGTTQQFLRSFGLSDLSQLPQMANDQVQEFRQEAEKEIDDRLGV